MPGLEVGADDAPVEQVINDGEDEQQQGKSQGAPADQQPGNSPQVQHHPQRPGSMPSRRNKANCQMPLPVALAHFLYDKQTVITGNTDRW